MLDIEQQDKQKYLIQYAAGKKVEKLEKGTKQDKIKNHLQLNLKAKKQNHESRLLFLIVD